MSLKTRCPACQTVFKIVPDQLKVSKGWVRCGRCAEVFDAAANAEAADEANPWPQANLPSTLVKNTTPSAVVASTTLSTTFPFKNIGIQAVNTIATATLDKNKEHLQPNFSFIKAAKSKAFWQQKNVSIGLRALCVCLAGLLFFQVIISQRNYLIASRPALKPSFEMMCQTFGCKIEPFNNIDAFKIDSSSFQKIGSEAAEPGQSEVFALKITFKNNSSLTLSMPAVELTLTDAADKPVLRRVLLAKDLGFIGATLAADSDWTGEMRLAVKTNPAVPTVSGYRVLLFYP